MMALFFQTISKVLPLVSKLTYLGPPTRASVIKRGEFRPVFNVAGPGEIWAENLPQLAAPAVNHLDFKKGTASDVHHHS